jgi:hypothetical protein
VVRLSAPGRSLPYHWPMNTSIQLLANLFLVAAACSLTWRYFYGNWPVQFALTWGAPQAPSVTSETANCPHFDTTCTTISHPLPDVSASFFSAIPEITTTIYHQPGIEGGRKSSSPSRIRPDGMSRQAWKRAKRQMKQDPRP